MNCSLWRQVCNIKPVWYCDRKNEAFQISCVHFSKPNAGSTTTFYNLTWVFLVVAMGWSLFWLIRFSFSVLRWLFWSSVAKFGFSIARVLRSRAGCQHKTHFRNSSTSKSLDVIINCLILCSTWFHLFFQHCKHFLRVYKRRYEYSAYPRGTSAQCSRIEAVFHLHRRLQTTSTFVTLYDCTRI